MAQSSDQRPSPQVERATGTVTVACKYPAGFILRLFKPNKEYEAVLGGSGSREITIHRPIGKTYRIKGPAAPNKERPNCPMAGGYALTPGIPADFWQEWLKQNEGADYVENHIISAHGQPDHIKGECKEHKDQKSGFERLDMSTTRKDGRNIVNDARVRAISKGTGMKVETYAAGASDE